MNTAVTIILSILVFGFLIFVHEFGHYIFARIFKVTVLEFSIGMGPKIITYKSKKTGIVYSLAAIPFGGFVSMAGEDGVYPEDENAPKEEPYYGSVDVAHEIEKPAEPKPEDPNGFDKKPAWQRFIITVAGAAVNVIVGFIVLLIFTSISSISSTTVGSLANIENLPEYVTSDELIFAGDEITAVNGRGVKTSDELVYEIMRNGNEPVDLTVIRGGQQITVNDVQFPVAVASGQRVGYFNFIVKEEEKNIGTVISHTFYKGLLMVRMCWEGLYDLITGRFGLEAVSGPVGISSSIGTAASQGIDSFLYLVALISINLGVMNMLPIPALDGGRTLTILIEMITRRRVPPKVERIINGVGLVVLLGFSVVVLVKDVIGLIF